MDQREPGWYRDPHDVRVHRHWDGERWTAVIPPVAALPGDRGEDAAPSRVGTASGMTTTPAEPVQDPAYEPIIRPGEDPGNTPDTEPDTEPSPEPQPEPQPA